MKTKNQKNGVWLGYDVLTAAGSFPLPQKICFWEQHKYKDTEPEAPFHYAADALVGLSLVHLNPHLQNPFTSPQMNYSFANESWNALEPHHVLFARSQPRIQALRDQMKDVPSEAVGHFERNFSEVLESAKEPWGFDLTKLHEMVDAIDYLEAKDERPLLYNFKTRFSREVLMQMHYLHSMLFNLRALIAMDYNAHVQDPTHEAAKIDSISDYLPKAEYVANDALLYWSFKRTKEEMPKSAVEKMEQAFYTYSHNAAVLVESLPQSFLKQMNWTELEETLYVVQMDWLLGTDAGLLFRLREELYGLVEGYDKVFYPELEGKPAQPARALKINVQVTPETLYPSSEAA
ncbi:MAG: hypothetical protein ACK5P7_03815 [Bdellovibrio sp.]